MTNDFPIDDLVERQGNRKDVQLRLPFEDGLSVMLVHEADLNFPAVFEEFIARYQPKWLLDIRVAPRMDFVAPTRASALRVLSALKVNYVDVLGRIGDTSKWLQFIENLVQDQNQAEGLYAIVFDDRSILQDARRHLSSLVCQQTQTESVSVSTFRRELLAM
ncbi:hypothetical protein [Achromobacter sp. ACM05]|uniref:hypothetical protein n=1 Tax=Achromobacter sp. ACM05 TaxID=2854776 RepID=UPI001C4536D2|nr:hypothetical protein [Achromobacter sp. ACM05]MBV7498809.1 hypothetical protein [Achromobacter sp. ACM05]